MGPSRANHVLNGAQIHPGEGEIVGAMTHLTALYKSVYYYYYFLAHQHKACRQLKIKQEMTAVGD